MSDESALLREPWFDFGRQREAGKFGIWVFLASEMLFFGALLLTYTVCRIEHPEDHACRLALRAGARLERGARISRGLDSRTSDRR